MNDQLVKINNWARYTRLLPRIGSHWARVLMDCSQIHCGSVRSGHSKNELVLGKLGLSLWHGQEWFVRGYKHALALVEHANAKFKSNPEGGIIISVAGVNAYVSTAQELIILQEIYVEGDYGLQVQGPIAVWDIGMNVGLASLYFAQQLGAQIVGYEPFPGTFAQAKANFALNPNLATRIEGHEFGIGATERTCVLDYLPHHRGSIGIFGPISTFTNDNQGTTAEVKIKAAPLILRELQARFPQHSIFAKIDCEGAEYEIIACLEKAGLLRTLSGVMIEWHRVQPEHDPVLLTNSLLNSGFCVFKTTSMSAPQGMIYAVRRS